MLVVGSDLVISRHMSLFYPNAEILDDCSEVVQLREGKPKGTGSSNRSFLLSPMPLDLAVGDREGPP